MPRENDTRPAGDAGPSDSGLTLLDIASAMVRWRWLVLGLPLTLALVRLFLVIGAPKTYVAGASFTSSTGSAGSPASGLAAQLGMSIQTGDASNTSSFFEALLESPELLRAAVDSPYTFRQDGRTVTRHLADVYQLTDGDALLRREMAVVRLNGDVSVSADPMTGIVRYTVRAPYPDLSLQVANRLLGLVNNFNLARRQTRATAEREFAVERLAEAQRALRQAENEVEYFLQRNRMYQGDPQLVVQLQRLQRSVAFRQDIATSLAQRAEQSGIDAVRNTPTISILERPVFPVKPAPRGRLIKVVSALVGGLVAALAIILVLEVARRTRRADPTGYLRLRAELLAARRQLQRFTRSDATKSTSVH